MLVGDVQKMRRNDSCDVELITVAFSRRCWRERAWSQPIKVSCRSKESQRSVRVFDVGQSASTEPAYLYQVHVVATSTMFYTWNNESSNGDGFTQILLEDVESF